MQILDRDFLIQNVDGDAELLEEIVDLFFESSADIVDTIREAVARADAEALNRSAHQLKGALANVGAEAAANVANELEQLGRNRMLTGLESSFAMLEAEMGKLEPALRNLVASHR